VAFWTWLTVFSSPGSHTESTDRQSGTQGFDGSDVFRTTPVSKGFFPLLLHPIQTIAEQKRVRQAEHREAEPVVDRHLN
jgi:hypothetical protein